MARTRPAMKTNGMVRPATVLRVGNVIDKRLIECWLKYHEINEPKECVNNSGGSKNCSSYKSGRPVSVQPSSRRLEQ